MGLWRVGDWLGFSEVGVSIPHSTPRSLSRSLSRSSFLNHISTTVAIKPCSVFPCNPNVAFFSASLPCETGKSSVSVAMDRNDPEALRRRYARPRDASTPPSLAYKLGDKNTLLEVGVSDPSHPQGAFYLSRDAFRYRLLCTWLSLPCVFVHGHCPSQSLPPPPCMISSSPRLSLPALCI